MIVKFSIYSASFSVASSSSTCASVFSFLSLANNLLNLELNSSVKTSNLIIHLLSHSLNNLGISHFPISPFTAICKKFCIALEQFIITSQYFLDL